MAQQALETIANEQQAKDSTLNRVYNKVLNVWYCLDWKSAGIFLAESVVIFGLAGFVLYHQKTKADNYANSYLSRGVVPGESIKNIKQTKCADEKIKFEITAGDQRYCVFATLDERVPLRSEPYSDKCECK